MFGRQIHLDFHRSHCYPRPKISQNHAISIAIYAMTRYIALALVLFSPVRFACAADDPNKVKPGEFVVDHPTLINLGFEWLIEGDANRNAQVEVWYRKRGDRQWKSGLPLLRLQGERI